MRSESENSLNGTLRMSGDAVATVITLVSTGWMRLLMGRFYHQYPFICPLQLRIVPNEEHAGALQPQTQPLHD